MKTRLLILVALAFTASLARTAERRTAQDRVPEGRAANRSAGSPSAAGLGFRADAMPAGLALRRPQDLIGQGRGLPGVYSGATDPLLAVALGTPASAEGAGSRVRRTLSFQTPAGPSRAIISRLWPAVLLESPEATLRLLPAPAAAAAAGRGRGQSAGTQLEGKLPRYLGWIEGGRPVIRAVADLAQPVPLRMDEPWVLLWFGNDAVTGGYVGVNDVDSAAGVDKAAMSEGVCPLDVPLLARFQRRPSSVGAGDGQIVFEFAEAADHVAIVPLFGRRIWLPEETEAWRSGLPEPVIRQCRHWSRWLRDYPLDVKESFEWDRGGDVLRVRQVFEWVSLEDDWQTPPVHAAPLPPMLAVALGGGVPVSFRAGGKGVQPVDGNLMDMAGKMMAVEGAEEYEYQVAGLGKYLWANARPAAVAPEAEDLQARLQRYAAEMVAAGHLRPLLLTHGGVGNWNASWYWLGTPENAYALARAYPYLTPDLQSKVAEYVKTEWQTHPPLELNPGSYDDGAPREPYAIEAASDRSDVVRSRDEAYRRRSFFLDLYRIAEAAAIIPGVPDTASLKPRAAEMAAALWDLQDWAILGPRRLAELTSPHEARFGTLQGSAAYNGWLAGAIGLARLADQHGWEEEGRLAVFLAAKLALARVGQARYVDQMHRMGLVRGEPQDDYRAVSHVDQWCTIVRWGPIGEGVMEDQEFPPFIDLVPEVGRLLADYARPQCQVYLSYLDRGVPFWYLSEAPKQSGTEQHLCPLWHQSGNVPAQAWILGRRNEQFARYVDVTRFRGDLFAIGNLVAAIEAFQDTQSSE